MPIAALFAPLTDEPLAQPASWFEGMGLPQVRSGGAGSPPEDASPVAETGALPLYRYPETGELPPARYSTMDATLHLPHGAAQGMSLPPPPVAPNRVAAPRWGLIVASAVAAVVAAFVVARLVRGSIAMEGPAVVGRAAGEPPRPPPPEPEGRPVAAAGSGSQAGAVALAQDRTAVAAGAQLGGTRPSPGVPPAAEQGETSAGGAALAGHGPCRLSVAATPVGSMIRLDDRGVGPAPITIEGSCDKHKIDVSHARYQSQARWVTLAAGSPQELEVILQRPIHAVTVTSFPPGAELSIDGRRAGTTPTLVQMTGFATVSLTFTKAGFQSVTKKVYSKLSQDRVFVKLMR